MAFCENCGHEGSGNFCAGCGQARAAQVMDLRSQPAPAPAPVMAPVVNQQHAAPALLSLFLSGLGQMVKGQIARGLAIWAPLVRAFLHGNGACRPLLCHARGVALVHLRCLHLPDGHDVTCRPATP